MINIGVCDDEEILRINVIELCDLYGKENNIENNYVEFSSGEEVLDYKGDIDILLLDVGLPGISGVELLKKIEVYENIKYVIFVTAYQHYIWNAFSTKTLGYLIKPLSYKDLSEYLGKSISYLRAITPIEIEVDNKVITLNNLSLLYIEATGYYVKLYTYNNTYLVRKTLKEWEEQLSSFEYLRVHKSYLVNMVYIQSIEKGEVILANGTSIKISRRRLSALKSIFRDYCLRSM